MLSPTVTGPEAVVVSVGVVFVGVAVSVAVGVAVSVAVGVAVSVAVGVAVSVAVAVAVSVGVAVAVAVAVGVAVAVAVAVGVAVGVGVGVGCTTAPIWIWLSRPSYFRWKGAPEMELAPQSLLSQPVPHPSGGEFAGSGSAAWAR
jgi:hypothetical protein